MSELKKLTDPDDIILYFEPAYLAVESERKGVPIPITAEPGSYHRIAKENQARAIFLTKIHPRRTRAGNDGLNVSEYIQDWSEPVWCSRSSIQSIIVSCLYRVK